MRQINLKTEGENLKRKTKISLSLVLGSLILIITGSIIGGIFLYENQLQNQIFAIEDDISEREKGIDEQGFREIYDLQGRITDVEKYSSESNDQLACLNLISSRTFGETIFDNLTLKQISSDSSLVDATIIIADVSRLSAQLNAYKKSDQIENLKLNESSLEERGLLAAITFTVKSSLPSDDEKK